jgi:hypothetical protein
VWRVARLTGGSSGAPRTEAERIARWIFASAVVCYAAIAAAIASGAIADPGVFASDVPAGRTALAVGALFVLAAFWLAYDTARQFRMPARPGALAALPADVDRFCALALAKSPGERFASGAALARALDAALDGALDPGTRARADAVIRRRPWEARR